MSTTTTPSTPNHRLLEGVVVSTKMQATAVVRVDRRVAHEKYGKYFTISKKFKVHNPDGKAKLGDIIEFEECRPLSRDKRWRYVATVKTVA
ncbi:30S ribosomal protein S17 [Patescibacteria group bacterium]|nr:30S ribosomal protein S17 [Patescibacteria group bacterium]